jgi:hypothetical protein
MVRKFIEIRLRDYATQYKLKPRLYIVIIGSNNEHVTLDGHVRQLYEVAHMYSVHYTVQTVYLLAGEVG